MKSMTHAEAQRALRRLKQQLEIALRVIDRALDLPLPNEDDKATGNAFAREIERAVGNVPSRNQEPLRSIDRVYLEGWFS